MVESNVIPLNSLGKKVNVLVIEDIIEIAENMQSSIETEEILRHSFKCPPGTVYIFGHKFLDPVVKIFQQVYENSFLIEDGFRKKTIFQHFKSIFNVKSHLNLLEK